MAYAGGGFMTTGEGDFLDREAAFEKDLAAVLHRHGVDASLAMPDDVLAKMVSRFFSVMRSANRRSPLHPHFEEGAQS